MKSLSKLVRLIPAFCVVFSWTTTWAQKPDPQPVSGNIDWVFDYHEGTRLSKETGKPMFVVFRCER